MRSILEKAIVHILNGDQGKAEALFHKFMVEKARRIHESLRQGEDIELNENWNSEIREEEYFDSDDLGSEEEGEGEEGDMPEMGGDADMAPDAEGPPVDSEMGGDAEEEMPDVMDDEEADFGAEDGAEGGNEVVDKIDNLESKIDELTAEFDRLMAQMEDGNGDGLGDEDLDDEGLGDGLGDEDAPDMEGDADFGDAADADGEGDVSDMDMGGEDTGEIADRMEDDMGDPDQPEHEMAEDVDMDADADDEMLEDITESVLAELDKITMPANAAKEVGASGKSVSGNDSSILPNHPADQRWQQAKPYLVKAEGDAHNDSFEPEPSPPTKKVKDRRNNNAGVSKLSKVPPKGDASALINKDFAGSHPATKSIVDGKASK